MSLRLLFTFPGCPQSLVLQRKQSEVERVTDLFLSGNGEVARVYSDTDKEGV